MSFLRALPLVIGTVALLATAAILIVHIVLATHISRTSPVQAAAGVSAALEGLVLIILAWSYSRYVFTARAVSSRSPVVVFGISLAACVVATAASIAAVVCLSKTASDLPHSVMGADQNNFLVGSSTVLGLSFACQIVFISLHFVWTPVPHHRGRLHHADEPRRLPQMHVKSIRYSQTSPTPICTRDTISMDSRSPPQSSSGRSATETMSSFRSCLSHVVRPVTSKTRLLSTREKYRHSTDSHSIREDSFDSWDTSTVDLHNRMTPDDEQEHQPRGFPSTLVPPPRVRGRSRSFSPARRPAEQLARARGPGRGQHPPPSSAPTRPVPPPNVTPGTVVVASPNAGQVISDRKSVRRMRGSSLANGQSPLSHQSSFEFLPSSSVNEQDEVEEQSEIESPSERKMTPPIPEWILTAGSRSSLTGYQSRKLRIYADPGC
ncbi:uncharacterized protein VDAG_09771 [Verticillium dahliae VdLs.17]|uniref:Uncharacterized protein n=1 Tax=Verticillium dahliae (strain VdLs.17 / ATCC MYA-4575 / FGSC 10137) TaxID=498257 RepID=G2XHL7_VERDV|nr:uncharacterized protein VDAG_09771 [Verticillium dahliae VdLs.17]EGY19311.1 hypothetical protein VDAG_09771 [Verticillium dahliae VdLs.17]